MSYLFSWEVMRRTGEEAFEGVFFAAAAVFVLGVTVAMFV